MRATSAPVRLADYRPYPFRLEAVALHFSLDEERTLVEGKLDFVPEQQDVDLILDGLGLELLALELDDAPLAAADYQLSDTRLIIPAALLSGRTNFTLQIQVAIYPASNLALEGLYKSHSMLCTQCEAEGFRRIMFYPDRPDVMSRFRVAISGAAARYPVMLSNGNLISEEEENGIRHVVWEDPIHKPCYLFALVAGQLERVADSFTTASGRKVALHMYVEEHNLNKCRHALKSLKKAMGWDELAYGREYDLDLFQIVATDDFNSGAMENKGLNIFNSECVLAHPDSSADDDYLMIEAIVAHEYFHNWSGNRVTLRDWFQLSLKEGFTVFRENQFVAAMHSAKTKRVEEALLICTSQFAEDASPLRHPVRPASYQQIRNFYTLTVYEKGAEVIRMLHTLLGETAFRQGTDLYFARHDGEAVRIEEFIACMCEASGKNLDQFMRWYTTAGTPRVKVDMEYDPTRHCCHITLTQSIKHAPNASPLHIPVATALFSTSGKQIGAPRLLELTHKTQRFTFGNVHEMPTPSLLRGFSAPVDLDFAYNNEQLHLLLEHEDDGYIRWKAAQKIKTDALLAAIGSWPQPHQSANTGLERIYQALLVQKLKLIPHSDDDKALLSLLLALPGYNYLAEQQQRVAVSATWHSHRYAMARLGTDFASQWQELATSHRPSKNFKADFSQIVKRRIHLQALSFLEAGVEMLSEDTWKRYLSANNMTQREQALETLVWHHDSSYREQALAHFYQKAQKDTALAGRWLELQACIPATDTCELVAKLTHHPLFDWHNPNKLRSLIGFFANRNPIGFHTSGGHEFFTDCILHIDSYNPQIAAPMATPLYRWRRFETHLSKSLQQQLIRLDNSDISADLREGVNKSLAHA